MPPKRSNPRATHRKVHAEKPSRSAAVAASRIRGKKRRDRDAYLTPQPSADAICWRLRRVIGPVSRIVEPSAGTGNFVRAAKEVWPGARIIAVDLYEKHHRDLLAAGVTSYVIGDWMKQDLRAFDADLHLGNPPFSEAEDHIAHSLAMLRDGAYLAHLLPVSFQCAQGRARHLYKNVEPVLDDESTWPGQRQGEWNGLKFVMPLAERPSYTEDGHTDMTEYDVYIFQKGYRGLPSFLPHCWRSDAAVLRVLAAREAANEKLAREALKNVEEALEAEQVTSGEPLPPLREAVEITVPAAPAGEPLPVE